MPLRQTQYGGECPLGRFQIDIGAGAGCYTNDPVEACFYCNFSDAGQKGFDLEKICQCPEDMSGVEYEKLKGDYALTESDESKLTKTGFQEFVRGNMTIPILPLEVSVEIYRANMRRLGLDDERHFVDIVHNGLGEICSMYYNPRTKRYELEPIKNRF